MNTITKEVAQKTADLFQAIADGKIVQWKKLDGTWVDCYKDVAEDLYPVITSSEVARNGNRFRVKPEEKYFNLNPTTLTIVSSYGQEEILIKFFQYASFKFVPFEHGENNRFNDAVFDDNIVSLTELVDKLSSAGTKVIKINDIPIGDYNV